MKIEALGSQTTTDSQTAISRCVRLTRGSFSCSKSLHEKSFLRTKDFLKVVTYRMKRGQGRRGKRKKAEWKRIDIVKKWKDEATENASLWNVCSDRSRSQNILLLGRVIRFRSSRLSHITISFGVINETAIVPESSLTTMLCTFNMFHELKIIQPENISNFLPSKHYD